MNYDSIFLISTLKIWVSGLYISQLYSDLWNCRCSLLELNTIRFSIVLLYLTWSIWWIVYLAIFSILRFIEQISSCSNLIEYFKSDFISLTNT